MADTKSIENTSADDEWASLPIIGAIRAKAPPVDPYLKPESVITEDVRYGGVSLPPLLHGIQPGPGLDGEPKDYSVKIMWVNRQQIDDVLVSMGHEQPQLSTVLGVVRSFMCNMDTMRGEAALGASLARKAAETGDNGTAIKNLEKIMEILGHWDDERRIYLH